MNTSPLTDSVGRRSRANSETSSYETKATSVPSMMPALQSKSVLDENDLMEPLAEEELDPGSFDLVAPPTNDVKQYSLETRSEQLFSSEHLKVIFSDPSLLQRFTGFLSAHRASSIPLLVYYLDAVKALKAITYANAISEALDPIPGCDFTISNTPSTKNTVLEKKAEQAFEAMVRDDLPAFVTHVYIQTVSLSISRRIAGTLPPHLREASEGLAEVFCLTDPSRPDNPIVFASEGILCSHTLVLRVANLPQSSIEQRSMVWNMLLDEIAAFCKVRRQTLSVLRGYVRDVWLAKSTVKFF